MAADRDLWIAVRRWLQKIMNRLGTERQGIVPCRSFEYPGDVFPQDE